MSNSPPATEPVGTVIPDMVCGAVAKVFQTMVHRNVRLLRRHASGHPISLLHELNDAPDPVVVGAVRFVGQVNGVVHLYLSEALAVQLTCDMLDLTRADLQPDEFALVKDAIGELTNVIAGNFKNQLCNRGLPCELTIPSILHGARFEVEAVADASHWLFEFETDSARFLADVLCDPIP